ncbi:MAG: YqgE/AlgH family protein [Bacteroidota bacterium]|nr:YqgE/AlgH family protein [Bacteroidota bacterium]MDP4211259.1 YqgE/AlgH family protein [Bacteroidota bacterium]MDP4250421.1 YqgE/AlgH family protein [Bacteroidota bacterium]
MDNPAAGILLIADPFLKDPNFKRSVIFLCEHQSEGSFGFLLNKTYEYTLKDLVQNAEDLEIPVFFGGPVQTDTIHFLHQYPDLIQGGYEVIDGIYWGGDFEKAIELIRSGEVTPGRIRFYIGYSGWASGQLDDELKEKSWLSVKANQQLIFHKKTEEIWKEAIRQLGGNYLMMINFPTDPQLN